MQNFTRLFSSSKSRFLGSVNSEIKKYLTRNEFRAFAVTSEMASDSNWRGVPLTEIWGSQSPWGAPEFPLVAPAFNHTVLYHIPSNGSVADDRPPKPQIGHDKWDHDYVRMPCSSQSLYPVEDDSGETHLKKRWELIETALCKPIRNSEELATAILSYNTQFKESWKFSALHKLFNESLCGTPAESSRSPRAPRSTF
ncbi:poly(ADP-ribose) glycohydrolase-like [Choristoneura fumiferana]|uniref:poly(ADP-ribose) glycohydrolase-like n=1 Tax=Choristoneura fumiferana TaxID=7141 RepID=UPI003D15ECE3